MVHGDYYSIINVSSFIFQNIAKFKLSKRFLALRAIIWPRAIAIVVSFCPSVLLLTFSCVHQNSETVHWIHLKFGIQMQNNMKMCNEEEIFDFLDFPGSWDPFC